MFFFFNDTATTEIYTLSLHDALPISRTRDIITCSSIPICRNLTSRSRTTSTIFILVRARRKPQSSCLRASTRCSFCRSEEHTSELQSRQYLVCRLLLEKKKIPTLASD